VRPYHAMSEDEAGESPASEQSRGEVALQITHNSASLTDPLLPYNFSFQCRNTAVLASISINERFALPKLPSGVEGKEGKKDGG
jgi:hypothetical protein